MSSARASAGDGHGADSFGDVRNGFVGYPAEAIGQMTTAALAQVLGKRNARAARDWCQRHGIPYRRDGKFNWVSVTDVRRVLDNLPVSGKTPTPSVRADAIVGSAMTLMRRN